MSRREYTPEHLAFLQQGYQSMNARNLTRAFNGRFGLDKTEAAVRSVLRKHRIMCGRKPSERLVERRHRLFTQEQEAFIREKYREHNIAGLTILFNEHFGTDRTREQIKAFTSRYKIHSGRTGCFPKGHKPWNTGTRGQGLTGANRGSFKKGSVPPNRKPLGSERVCPKNGFIHIKVAQTDPYTGFPTRYKQKHVHIWEQANGPVPKGMAVAFRNGNKLDCRLKNLMLVTRAELLELNRQGYRTVPDDIKPSVLALSKLRVRAFALEKDGNREQEAP